MALIKCKECGKNISDTVKKCPHCGYVNEILKNEKLEKGKNFFQKNKKLIIIIGLIIAVSIVGMIIYNKKVEQDRIQNEIIANTLNDDERMIASVIKEYQSKLKNPNSLQVFEIIYHKADDGSATVIFDTSGQNGFGGTTRNRVMYLLKADGTKTYWGDDSEADKTITKYTDFEDKLKIGASKVVKEYWKERKDYIIMDTDKIMRNLDQAEN